MLFFNLDVRIISIFYKGVSGLSREKVEQYLEKENYADRIIVLEDSSATVEEAAHALGCEPEHIAKTMSFLLDEKPRLVVMAGDAKVDNRKFKDRFHKRPRMIASDVVEKFIGHAPGGVCPFAVNDGVDVYLDDSLKKYETVFPACGSSNSAAEFTPAELEKYSQNFVKWVDVSKSIEQ